MSTVFNAARPYDKIHNLHTIQREKKHATQYGIYYAYIIFNTVKGMEQKKNELI